MATFEISQKEVTGLHLTPYTIGGKGVAAMSSKQKERFAGKMKIVSDVLKNDGKIKDAWDAFVDNFGVDGFDLADLSFQDRGLDEHRRWAKLRNRFVTPAHRELWIDGITRIINGQVGDAPKWAKEIVDEWSRGNNGEGVSGENSHL